MSAIALNDRDLNLMGVESDGANWTLIVGALGAITTASAFFTGLFWRTRDLAAADGKTAGEVAAWRLGVDAGIVALRVELQANEGRANTRIAALEQRKDILDARMATFPTRDEVRDEMRAGFDRIERQMENLNKFIHERGYRPSSTT